MLDLETRERAASPERERIVEALIEIAAERGYAETTIELIVERAGLDRPAFDRHFRGKYDCFISAWALARVSGVGVRISLGAYESPA